MNREEDMRRFKKAINMDIAFYAACLTMVLLPVIVGAIMYFRK